MKSKFILSGLAAMALALTANADVTINITGSTAFRGAAHQSIKNSFTTLADFAHTGTAATDASLNGASQAIFQGTFPGISGTTTIRTGWSGSVEGIRDLATNQNVNFLTTAAFGQGTASGNQNFGVPAGTDPALAILAFSDVYPSSSPYNVSGLVDSTPGVVTFSIVANESSAGVLDNITAQQFRLLCNSGSAPLSVFTGSAADTKSVFLSGRNDGSGTRTTVLAETGYGYTIPVNQWKPTVVGNAITILQYWPAPDGGNSSIVWGNNIAGNGGFSSGSGLTTALGATSTNVELKDQTGGSLGTGNDLLLVGYQGTGDALTAVTAGAVALAYNGVKITPASPLSASDIEKVTNGQYTLWGYQHLIQKGTLTGDNLTFFTALTAAIPANLGASGIAFGDMVVSRTNDGGLVGP